MCPTYRKTARKEASSRPVKKPTQTGNEGDLHRLELPVTGSPEKFS